MAEPEFMSLAWLEKHGRRMDEAEVSAFDNDEGDDDEEDGEVRVSITATYADTEEVAAAIHYAVRGSVIEAHQREFADMARAALDNGGKVEIEYQNDIVETIQRGHL